MQERKIYLKMAIEEAFHAIRNLEGGPFGAVIARYGELLGKGHNTVLRTHDPTAHAEVNAIRDACRHVRDHHLTGAVIFSNFEPCPMCLSAIYWADIREVYYCSGREEAEKIGFMDKHLYREFTLPEEQREVVSTRIAMEEMGELMKAWNSQEGKVLY
jgi:guanine deaminase